MLSRVYSFTAVSVVRTDCQREMTPDSAVVLVAADYLALLGSIHLHSQDSILSAAAARVVFGLVTFFASPVLRIVDTEAQMCRP